MIRYLYKFCKIRFSKIITSFIIFIKKKKLFYDLYFLIIIFTGFYLVTFNFSINMVFIIILFFSLISVLLITLKKKGADRMHNEQKYFKDTLNILKSYLEIKVYKKVKFFNDQLFLYAERFIYLSYIKKT